MGKCSLSNSFLNECKIINCKAAISYKPSMLFVTNLMVSNTNKCYDYNIKCQQRW